MVPSIAPSILEGLIRLCRSTHGLEMVLLFGSRARGDDRPGADWDFGYLGTNSLDLTSLLGGIIELVGTDQVDLADLGRANGLLRYRAARDGHLVYEARPLLAEKFRFEAVQFWCDAAHVLQPGYDELLAELGQ